MERRTRCARCATTTRPSKTPSGSVRVRCGVGVGGGEAEDIVGWMCSMRIFPILLVLVCAGISCGLLGGSVLG
jgi:hypothetical protein